MGCRYQLILPAVTRALAKKHKYRKISQQGKGERNGPWKAPAKRFPVPSPVLPMLLLLHQSSRNGLTVVSASELDRLIPIIFNHIFQLGFIYESKKDICVHEMVGNKL